MTVGQQDSRTAGQQDSRTAGQQDSIILNYAISSFPINFMSGINQANSAIITAFRFPFLNMGVTLAWYHTVGVERVH
jgi:hypothetical protein